MARDYVIAGVGAALLFRNEIFTLALLLLGVTVLVVKLFTACAERRY